MISSKLRAKAVELLNNRKNANVLPDLLNQFKEDGENQVQLLLCYEMIFTEFLKRGEMIIDETETKFTDKEIEFRKWLQECYETCWKQILECIENGKMVVRLQGIVTAMKILAAEGQHPIETNKTAEYYFPIHHLKEIFSVILHNAISMLPIINRFQEYTEYLDVAEFGLKALVSMPIRKDVSQIFIKNYLELLDKLLSVDLSNEKSKHSTQGEVTEEEEQKVLCFIEGKPLFSFSMVNYKRYANKAWTIATQWPLCAEPKTHRRALLLFIERLLPILSKPQLATDMLMDSLDSGGAISMLALQGVLELVRRHNIDYPDIYDRLYAMLEPEMFATRFKRRLIHLTDIFLSSTHLPEALVAAFAKRLSRLALVAPPDDAIVTLQLIGNLIHRHTALKRMVCHESPNTVMSRDPYVSEETTASASCALQSSLWEINTLRSHALPAIATAADRLLNSIDSRETTPIQLDNSDGDELFEVELKKRFKSIEVNFSRPQSMALTSGERLAHYWHLT